MEVEVEVEVAARAPPPVLCARSWCLCGLRRACGKRQRPRAAPSHISTDATSGTTRSSSARAGAAERMEERAEAERAAEEKALEEKALGARAEVFIEPTQAARRGGVPTCVCCSKTAVCATEIEPLAIPCHACDPQVRLLLTPRCPLVINPLVITPLVINWLHNRLVTPQPAWQCWRNGWPVSTRATASPFLATQCLSCLGWVCVRKR